MPNIFTITRSIIGPLTAIATLPDECSGCYGIPRSLTWGWGPSWDHAMIYCHAFELHNACAGIEGDSAPPPCLPTTTNDWGFYSPGLHCPAGWETQDLELSYDMAIPTRYNTTRISRALDLLTKDETAVFCCPSHYSISINDVRDWTLAACAAPITSGDFVVSACHGRPSVTESTFRIPLINTSPANTAATTDAGISFAPIIQLVWRPQDWIVTSTEPPVVTTTSPSNKPPPPSPSPKQTSPPSTPTTTSNPPTTSSTGTSSSPAPSSSTTHTSPSSSSSTNTTSSSSTFPTKTTESSESNKLTNSSSKEATKTSAALTEKGKTTTTSSSSADGFDTLSTSSSSHIDTTSTTTKTDELSTSESSETSNTKAGTLPTSATSSTTAVEPAASNGGGDNSGSLFPTTTKTITATTVTVGVLGFLGFGLWFGVFRKRRKNFSDDERNSSNPERAVLDGPIKPELPATTTLPSGAAHTGGSGGPEAMTMSGAGAGTTLEQHQQENTGIINDNQPELEGAGGAHAGGGGGISPIAEHPAEQNHLLYDHSPNASELTAQHETTQLEEQRHRVELEEQERQPAELMAMTTTLFPTPGYSQGPYPYPYAYPQPQQHHHQQAYHYPGAVELESPLGWSPQAPHYPPPRSPRSPHTPGDRTRPESDISQGQGRGQYAQASRQGSGRGQSPQQPPSLRGRASPRQSPYLGSGSSPRPSPRPGPGVGAGGWDHGQGSGPTPSRGREGRADGGGAHEQGQAQGYM